MEKQIAELMSSVDDIKKTQESIMNRIETWMPSEDQQDCNCNHDTEQLQKDISQLRDKEEALEHIDKEQNQKHLILSENVKGLQDRLDSIEKLCSGEVLRSYAAQTRKESVDDIHAMGFKEAPDNADITKTDTTLNVGSAFKPNILKEEKPEVKQAESLMLHGDGHWRLIAQNVLDRGRAQCLQLEGVYSVICLDISESMSEGNAWSQAQTFLTHYLRGLEDMSELPNLRSEYVALVTFGNETQVQLFFTDRYSDVQKIIDNLNLGGPSQMYGGILMAQAVASSPTHKGDQLENGALVFTKIVMISDGRPTEADLIAGPDIADNSKLDDTKTKILQLMEFLQNNNEDLFIVPVGTPDMAYLETMVAVSNGIMLTYKSGRRLARRQYLSAQLIDPVGLTDTDTLTLGSDNNLSSEDKEDMRCVQMRTRAHVVEIESARPEAYFECNNTSLPPPGTRVRRGPDWEYDSQDSFGPGTIIGHCDDNHRVWVKWDATGKSYTYRYGIHGNDVLTVDEPRVLQTGQKMDVGCEVKPSKDWRCSDQIFERGVILKMDRLNNKAMVRWSNGMRGDYSYGDGGPQEIELLMASQKTSQSGYGDTFQSSSQPGPQDGFQITSQNESLGGFHSAPLGGYMSSNITSISLSSVNREIDDTGSHLIRTRDLGRSRKSAVCDDLRDSKKTENIYAKRDKNKNKK